jgi:hypothetical protein
MYGTEQLDVAGDLGQLHHVPVDDDEADRGLQSSRPRPVLTPGQARRW